MSGKEFDNNTLHTVSHRFLADGRYPIRHGCELFNSRPAIGYRLKGPLKTASGLVEMKQAKDLRSLESYSGTSSNQCDVFALAKHYGLEIEFRSLVNARTYTHFIDYGEVEDRLVLTYL